MIYGYARVSTAGQDPAAQFIELKAAGCGPVFVEKASAKGGAKRPQLAKALAALQPGDVLVVVRLNRLARSARDALNTLATIAALGAQFRSLREQWCDTTTPMGRLVVTIMSGLAEFDREMILERTAEGRESAKAQGVRFGRKPTLTAGQAAFIVKARAERPPVPIGQLVALLNVSRSTVARCIAAGSDGLSAAAYLPDPAGQIDLEEITGARPPV